MPDTYSDNKVTLSKEQLGKQENDKKQDEFKRDLTQLLNKHSLENLGNTPDFILAEYIIECLKNYSFTVTRRDNWYGDRR